MPAPRSPDGRSPKGARPLLKHIGSIGTSFCEVNALRPALDAQSELRSADSAPCGITSVEQQYLERADSFQVAPPAQRPCAIICPPCPTRRRPTSSVPCREGGPSGEATSAVKRLRLRLPPKLVARRRPEGRAPKRCASPSSRRARPRPRGAADRFRPPGRSCSRPSRGPRRSWPKSDCR